MVADSSQDLVAFFSLQGEFTHQRFQPGILSGQTRFALALLMNLKGFGRMGQKLVAPLIILGLADQMLSAHLGHGLALETLKHENEKLAAEADKLRSRQQREPDEDGEIEGEITGVRG